MSASQSYVANRDVVQTALYALGLEKGRYMTGKVLHEAFAGSEAGGIKDCRDLVNEARLNNGFQLLLLLCTFIVCSSLFY